ncbi:succinylglutamate desuccinylase/aspartoacylase family protein [Gallaecimonas sp. GXIMD4217]|uniref:succinylglutamate desuccinylase/aspartoacylase family protein n=1 Tax=Gallaecimonas sp. GXIMD4217 TaxID=3131927 RepID=UPI00311B29CA
MHDHRGRHPGDAGAGGKGQWRAADGPLYRFRGRGCGPSVYIQANLHGAEVQGNAVIYQLLQLLPALERLGDISLVPMANPLGLNQKSGEFTLGRFDPVTGQNWNRLYADLRPDLDAFLAKHGQKEPDALKAAYRQALLTELEQRLAEPLALSTGRRLAMTLQRQALQADLVLDLHTGPVSASHLYVPDYARESARLFDIPHVLLIPNQFDGALDESVFCPWWRLGDALAERGRALSLGVEAFTVELGSQEDIDLAEAGRQAGSILAYLTRKGVIGDCPYQPRDMVRHACLLRDYQAIHSPAGGFVQYLARPGRPLPAGEPLARLLRLDGGGHARDITLERDVLPILHFASASVNQGTELYKVFTKPFAL